MTKLLAALLLSLGMVDGGESSASECQYKPLIVRLSDYMLDAAEEGDDKRYEEMNRLMAIERSKYHGLWEHLIQLDTPIAFDSVMPPDTSSVMHLAAYHKGEIPAIRLLRWTAETPSNLVALLAVPDTHHSELDTAYINWLFKVGEECAEFTVEDYTALSNILDQVDGYVAEAAIVGWVAPFRECPVQLCEIARNSPDIESWLSSALFYETYHCESMAELFRILPEETHCYTKELIRALGGPHSRCLDELVLEKTEEPSCTNSER